VAAIGTAISTPMMPRSERDVNGFPEGTVRETFLCSAQGRA
jgi:hypothetical protein